MALDARKKNRKYPGLSNFVAYRRLRLLWLAEVFPTKQRRTVTSQSCYTMKHSDDVNRIAYFPLMRKQNCNEICAEYPNICCATRQDTTGWSYLDEQIEISLLSPFCGGHA